MLSGATSVGPVGLLSGRVLLPLAQAPDRGALPQLFAATDPDAVGGQFGPGGTGELRGAPKAVRLARGPSTRSPGGGSGSCRSG